MSKCYVRYRFLKRYFVEHKHISHQWCGGGGGEENIHNTIAHNNILYGIGKANAALTDNQPHFLSDCVTKMQPGRN